MTETDLIKKITNENEEKHNEAMLIHEITAVAQCVMKIVDFLENKYIEVVLEPHDWSLLKDIMVRWEVLMEELEKKKEKKDEEKEKS